MTVGRQVDMRVAVGNAPQGPQVRHRHAGRVLVVDDDPSVLETTAAILSREGYEILTAGGLEEALGRLHASTFEVVLTDLRLEGESGLSLVSALRHHWPDTMPIVFTGYSALDTALDALREGAFDYLAKPVQVEDLTATVARAVDRSVMARGMRERLQELDNANAHLHTFVTDLELRVDETTRELTQKVKELSEAHRQREEFVSMIAHELGQPITVISGYAQLLRRGTLASDFQERASEGILVETRRLTRLVQDLGVAAHLAVGRFRLEIVECDLGKLVHDQVERAQTTAEQRTLRWEAETGPLLVSCDPDRVAQVISNLIENGLKYTSGGAIVIRSEMDSGHAVISVSDEGPGIPADRLDTIFEPYVRLGSPEAQSSTGTGLGLYIARGIARAHGGDLRAELNPSGGTTFILQLPTRPLGE